MIKEIYLANTPSTIQVVINALQREKIWIKLANATQKNTYYTKRFAIIDGQKTFYLRLPQAPENVNLIVYNDKNKLQQTDRSFKVVGINILPLQTDRLKVSKKTKSFIRFAQEFCEMCGILQASNKGIIYKSDNGKFRIDYFDIIRSKGTGNKIPTPARISQMTGRMEVSKEMFEKYSVPMRMAILLHEYSHFHINKNPSSEVQADLNGLTMYLSMGYPRIDAYNVFLNVFKTSSNRNNLNRFHKLDAFIKNWNYERQ